MRLSAFGRKVIVMESGGCVNRMARALAVIVVVGCGGALAFSRSAHSSPQDATPSRSFEFSEVVHVPAMAEGSKELRLWIPIPFEESHQPITELKIDSPVPYRIEHEAEYGNRYAYLAVDAAQAKAPFDIRISFHAQRFENRVPLTGGAQSASQIPIQPVIAPARFLKADHLVPTDGVIADLSQKERGEATQPVDIARDFYNYIVATMHYDHDGTEWGRGDAVWACDSKHGNCTDFHSVFIGMARAAGIPARFEIGFSLPANSHEAAITSYHCWAQFYVQGIGWVPVDASEAWKNKDKRDYFFGAIDTNRLMMSLGRDIRLNPPQQGDPLNYFVYPYAELDGKAFSGLKNEYSFRDSAAAGPTVASSR
jgi:transglutaminase-like putative cysteine protease